LSPYLISEPNTEKFCAGPAWKKQAAQTQSTKPVEYMGIVRPRSEVQELQEDNHPQSSHTPDVQRSNSYMRVILLNNKRLEMYNSEITRTNGFAPETPVTIVDDLGSKLNNAEGLGTTSLSKLQPRTKYSAIKSAPIEPPRIPCAHCILLGISRFVVEESGPSLDKACDTCLQRIGVFFSLLLYSKPLSSQFSPLFYLSIIISPPDIIFKYRPFFISQYVTSISLLSLDGPSVLQDM
jgi:hypothetical protein